MHIYILLLVCTYSGDCPTYLSYLDCINGVCSCPWGFEPSNSNGTCIKKGKNNKTVITYLTVIQTSLFKNVKCKCKKAEIDDFALLFLIQMF